LILKNGAEQNGQPGLGLIAGSSLEFMASRPAGSNLRVASRVVRSLRRRESLDEGGELVASLLLTTASLLDEVTAAGSDVPVYARSQAARAHSMVIEQLLDVVNVGAGDSFEDFMEMLKTPLPEGVGERAPLWDDVYGPPRFK
jgi:hypothetical protein